MFEFIKKLFNYESEADKITRECQEAKERIKANKNIMHERLCKLCLEVNAIYCSDFKSENFKVTCDFASLLKQIYTLRVNTALGWRTYTLIKELGMGGSYCSCDLELQDTFKLHTLKGTYCNEVIVTPLLGKTLLAKDIDLAVLELENIFKGYYDKREEELEAHIKEVEKLREGAVDVLE